MGFILTLIAILLSWVLFPIGLLYSFVKLMIKAKFIQYINHLNKMWYSIALSIDQLGNVILQHIMNDFLIEDNGFRFGDPDMTISYVLGANKYRGTLTDFGHNICDILDFFDPNHCLKTYMNGD